jgi:hypothetical protein
MGSAPGLKSTGSKERIVAKARAKNTASGGSVTTKIVGTVTKTLNTAENQTIPREIKVTIPEGRVWKGVPGGAAEAAWRKSFEPGYKPQVISPRDAQGGYDPSGSTFAILTEKEQASEIAVSLGKEGKPIPTSLMETLKEKLGIASNDVKKTQPPTNVTLSKPTAKTDMTGRNLINKYTDGLKADPNIVGIIIVIVLGLAIYIWKK